MRILYITEWSPFKPTGVLRKIIGQVTAWKEQGHTVQLYSIVPPQSCPAAFEYDQHGETFGLIPQGILDRASWARLGYLNKILTVPKVLDRLRTNPPDIIYYRQQGPWYPGLERILRCAPFVLEINTLPSEVRYWGRGLALFAVATNRRLWSRAAGFVCVSHSAARVYSRFGKPVKIVPNSMWGSGDMRLPPSGNRSPVFVFVGSGGQAWHGIDKILQLAAALPECHFHIVGLSRQELLADPIPTNVIAHGPLFGQALVDIYRLSDVGISTLALHRLGFDNTSSLKTLEYLMYGLPVVLGCRETAAELNDAEYTLSLPNTPSNVLDNTRVIQEFGERWRDQRVDADLSYLSRETLELQRLQFLEEIASVCKPK